MKPLKRVTRKPVNAEPELPGTGKPHPAIDWLGGEHLKLEGIQRVLFNSGDEWKGAAMHVMRRLARKKQFVTADDFHEIAMAEGLIQPHSPNSIGALFHHAGRMQVIRRTKETTPSVRPTRHANEIRIWESLLWKKT